MDIDQVKTEIGRRYALRYLLADIVTRMCRQQPDPADYAERWAKLNLGGWDSAYEKSGGDEVLNHATLHELETFWATVQTGLQGSDGKTPKPDGA